VTKTSEAHFVLGRSVYMMMRQIV